MRNCKNFGIDIYMIFIVFVKMNKLRLLAVYLRGLSLLSYVDMIYFFGNILSFIIYYSYLFSLLSVFYIGEWYLLSLPFNPLIIITHYDYQPVLLSILATLLRKLISTPRCHIHSYAHACTHICSHKHAARMYVRTLVQTHLNTRSLILAASQRVNVCKKLPHLNEFFAHFCSF